MGGSMSEDLIKKYNLEEADFWTLRGKKIISFGGVVKMIDTEGIKFEMSDNLEHREGMGDAIKVKAWLESDELGFVEEETFGEANDLNCKNQYFWAMAEKRGKARATLKLLGLYGGDFFYTDVESDDWQVQPPTVTQVTKFDRLEKEALEKGILDKQARQWLKTNKNGIRNNIDVYNKAIASLGKYMEVE